MTKKNTLSNKITISILVLLLSIVTLLMASCGGTKDPKPFKDIINDSINQRVVVLNASVSAEEAPQAGGFWTSVDYNNEDDYKAYNMYYDKTGKLISYITYENSRLQGNDSWVGIDTALSIEEFHKNSKIFWNFILETYSRNR